MELFTGMLLGFILAMVFCAVICKNASRLPPQRSGGRQDAVVGHSGIGNNEQKGKAT
jgi:hypothetical protein